MLADQGGEVPARRLTELEYINTLRVLTGITVPDGLVPDDESGTDFNTLGHYQTFSPARLEQYEAAARYAVEQLLRPSPRVRHTTVREDNWREKRRQKERELKKHREAHARAKKVPSGTADYRPYGFRNDAEYENALKQSAEKGFYVPLLAHYLANSNTKTGMVLYQASMGPLIAGIPGVADSRSEFIFRARVAAEDGMPDTAKVLRLTSFQSGNKRTLEYFHVHGTMDEPQIIETVVRPDPGKFGLQLGFSDLFFIRKANTTAIQQGKTVPGFWVDWVEIEGPIYSGRHEKARHELLQDVDVAMISERDARTIFESFGGKAFRGKQLDGSFVGHLSKIFRAERNSGKAPVESLVLPLIMILSSPEFLYLRADKTGRDKGLSASEMATRLSYLLWKEPADVDLLAEGDRLLTDQTILSETIDSMMADRRFDHFVREFFGQWLQLRKFDGVIFELKQVPDYGVARKHFAKEQLYEFVTHVIREDLSLANLIDSDFTLLNGTMARFYRDLGSDIAGDEFVRVALNGSARRRGGILGMSVIQAMGSTGAQTSPVERGAFILRKLLNSPPPPPPPNVPQLKHDDKTLSVRE